MLVITYNYLAFKKKEIWFYRNEQLEEGGYNTYCYVAEPFRFPYDRVLTEHTSCIDLRRSEEELWQGMHRTTRYQTRKCEHLGLTYQCTFAPSIEECRTLVQTFGDFARRKGILTKPRRIFALQTTGNLAITRIMKGPQVLYTHVYLFDPDRITLLHTFNNIDAAPLTNANKLLHWKDILQFKAKGFNTYDLGGIDLQKVPGISRFKLSFGGTLEPVNSYTRLNPIMRLLDRIYRKLV